MPKNTHEREKENGRPLLVFYPLRKTMRRRPTRH